MPLHAGSVLNTRYRIEDKLGRGGMGAVYLAFDQTLQIRVALKENLNLNPESERQFQREATPLARLRHPHLAGPPRITRAPPSNPHPAARRPWSTSASPSFSSKRPRRPAPAA